MSVDLGVIIVSLYLMRLFIDNILTRAYFGEGLR